MSYSIVKNGRVVSSGHPRPKRVGNTFVGASSDLREFGYYTEKGNKPVTGPYEEAVIDTAVLNTIDGVVELTYRIEQLPPPSSISRRQAKQQLLLDGLLANVQPTIDSIADTTERGMVQIYWDDAQEFERDHPQLINLSYALGLADAQIDSMFKAASQL